MKISWFVACTDVCAALPLLLLVKAIASVGAAMHTVWQRCAQMVRRGNCFVWVIPARIVIPPEKTDIFSNLKYMFTETLLMHSVALG